ncbi:MAG: 2-oxoglutarate dehydrogenase complex dihydrolipoyllysine-residue succinyltransferase [Phycisphaerae bacterium]
MPTAVIDLQVPGLGESVTEARIANWVKSDGQFVGPDDVVAELETDKATVELPAGNSGVLRIVCNQGKTVNVGDVIARIEPGAAPKVAADAPPTSAKPSADAKSSTPAPAPKAAADKPLAPSVQRLVTENQLDASKIPATGPGNRITKGDVLQFIGGGNISTADAAAGQQSRDARNSNSVRTPPREAAASDEETRVELSKLRETIAKRLVEAQHTAAILTTFNEIDMSAVMALREKYKEKFEKTHSVGLGFLSFFGRAVCAAAKAVPAVNAQLQDKTIVYKHRMHLGVAVATEKGLVVPVVRNADQMSMAQIELEIKRLATKAREGKIAMDDLTGGTFTITNGGVFGSLMSTPILNPPQSAILGLHKIEKRAVVVNDQIVIRPMMYVALSYDHRIIDGQQAVTFLVHVKESLEDPSRLLLEI